MSERASHPEVLDEWVPLIPRDMRLSYSKNPHRLKLLEAAYIAMHDAADRQRPEELLGELHDEKGVVFSVSGLLPGLPADHRDWNGKTWNVPRGGRVVRIIPEQRRLVGVLLAKLAMAQKGPWTGKKVCTLSKLFCEQSVDEEQVERWLLRSLKRRRQSIRWDVLQTIIPHDDGDSARFLWSEGFEPARTSSRSVEMVYEPHGTVGDVQVSK